MPDPIEFERYDSPLSGMTEITVDAEHAEAVIRELESEEELRFAAASNSGLQGSGMVRLTFLPKSAFNG